MRIEVIKELDGENREVYGFSIFDFNVVFVRYKLETKPAGKRKWNVIKFWDNYDKRSSNVMEPELTFGIRAEALAQAQDLINVKTFDQWKNNK